MKPITLRMDNFGGALFVDTDFWNKKINRYQSTSLTFDTGATITTISKDILFRLGYNIVDGDVKRITTASHVEYVQEVIIDRIKLGGYELKDIKVYAHSFPMESFSSGVLGLDVLSQFDINLLFSKKLIELYPLAE